VAGYSAVKPQLLFFFSGQPCSLGHYPLIYQLPERVYFLLNTTFFIWSHSPLEGNRREGIGKKRKRGVYGSWGQRGWKARFAR